ncbi:hypothetical protein HJFPF1_12006 [Paramyrothecium foliicola]|nr:hypothetical protein HJFPF1_12006 [Paramyrothecium foliicola]
MNRSTGISDEAAVAEHDLMANAEREEQRLHPTDSMTEDPNEQSRPTGLGSSAPGKQPGRKESIADKVKEALHLKK